MAKTTTSPAVAQKTIYDGESVQLVKDTPGQTTKLDKKAQAKAAKQAEKEAEEARKAQTQEAAVKAKPAKEAKSEEFFRGKSNRRTVVCTRVNPKTHF